MLAALLVLASVGIARSQAQVQARPGETLLVLAVQDKGSVVIRLETAKAPKTSARIISLAESGFYNGLAFHRVARRPRPFLVQFGDESTRQGAASVAKPSSTIAYEDSGLPNEEGTVGLSAPEGNRDGGDVQFHINLDNNRFLDGSYTVFGRVTQGMDLVKGLQVGDRVVRASIVRG